jgi:hypothetical protein
VKKNIVSLGSEIWGKGDDHIIGKDQFLMDYCKQRAYPFAYNYKVRPPSDGAKKRPDVRYPLKDCDSSDFIIIKDFWDAKQSAILPDLSGFPGFFGFDTQERRVSGLYYGFFRKSNVAFLRHRGLPSKEILGV